MKPNGTGILEILVILVLVTTVAGLLAAAGA